MSSVIDEALLAANEADVSVPIFVSINPDGSLGLNYLGLTDNALGNPPPRYHGVYSYRNIIGHGPIVPYTGANANLNSGDLISIIASDTQLPPHFTGVMWHCIAQISGGFNPPPFDWIFIGGNDLTQGDFSGLSYTFAGGGGIWVPMNPPNFSPGVTQIGVSMTGFYELWLEAQASLVATSELVLAVFNNGVEIAESEIIALNLTANSIVFQEMRDHIPVQLTAGDLLTLEFQSSAGGSSWNKPAFGIRPTKIHNVQ